MLCARLLAPFGGSGLAEWLMQAMGALVGEEARIFSLEMLCDFDCLQVLAWPCGLQF